MSSTSDKGPKLGLKRGRKKKKFHLIHKKSHGHSQYIPKLLREKNAQGVFNNGDTKDEGFIDDEGSWVDESRYCKILLIYSLHTQQTFSLTKLEAYADAKLNVPQLRIPVFDRVENIVGKKRKNCWIFSFSANVFQRLLSKGS